IHSRHLSAAAVSGLRARGRMDGGGSAHVWERGLEVRITGAYDSACRDCCHRSRIRGIRFFTPRLTPDRFLARPYAAFTPDSLPSAQAGFPQVSSISPLPPSPFFRIIESSYCG